MRLRILLIALISTTLGQEQNAQRSARAPQAQIKYNDPNGLKVDWKFFAPQNQWRSHLQKSQHPQQAEPRQPQQQEPQQPPQSELVQIESDQLEPRSYQQHQVHPQAQQIPNQIAYKTSYVQPQPVEPQPEQHQLQYKTYPHPQGPAEPQQDPNNQIQYNRYENIPPHVKQMILENLKPSSSHPDPSAYAYSPNVPQQYEQHPGSPGIPQYEQHPANAGVAQYEQPSEAFEQEEQQKSRREYSDSNYQGRIVYREEYEQQQQQQEPQLEQLRIPFERLPAPLPSKVLVQKNMPKHIQELLQYQSRLPYEVIANGINYKPKSLFIPKLLPADIKGPYHYRSKVYYLNNEQNENDYGAGKPIEENQRH